MGEHIVNKIKKITPVVKELLEKHEVLRDNDKHLWGALVLKLLQKNEKDSMSLKDFFILYASTNDLPTQETIGRTRRKLQQENPELKGKTEEARKEEEEYTRKNINKPGDLDTQDTKDK